MYPCVEMDVYHFTREVELAIMSIKERIERATGPDYDELNDALWETELLFFCGGVC